MRRFKSIEGRPRGRCALIHSMNLRADIRHAAGSLIKGASLPLSSLPRRRTPRNHPHGAAIPSPMGVGQGVHFQRRAALVNTAARVLMKKDYQAASDNDVVRAVGMDRASLFYYVSGNEELFQEVIRGATLGNFKLVEICDSSSQSPPEKLRSFIVALMQPLERHYP